MSIKRATLEACGGDVLAAWALDTLRWASETVAGPGDGSVPWTVRRLSEVSGLSYRQAKKAVSRLVAMGHLETRRGAMLVTVDLRGVAHSGTLDGPTVGHSTGPQWDTPTYTRYRVVTGGVPPEEGAVVEGPFDGTKGSGDDLPEKGGRSTPKTRFPPSGSSGKRGVSPPDPTAAVERLAGLPAGPDNLRKLWQALNVERGYAPSQGWSDRASSGAVVRALGEKAGLSILPAVVQVHRDWPGWSAHVRATTGMKAPLVPMLWHVNQNAHLLADFLAGADSGPGWRDGPADDVPADGKLTPEELAELKAKGVIW